MKTKRRLALFLVLAMVLTCMGPVAAVKAADDSYVQVMDHQATLVDIEPGQVTHVSLPVRARADIIMSPIVTGVTDKDDPFTIGEVTMVSDSGKTELLGINNYETTYLNFDITTKDSASIGIFDFGIQINTYFNEQFEYQSDPVTQTIAMQARITKEMNPTQITISNVEYDEDLAAIGNTFDLSFDVTNEGEIKALNTYLNIDYDVTGMIPGYTVESIKVGDLDAGAKQRVTVPVKVLPTAEEGYKTISVGFTYKNVEGTPGTTTKKIYITIKKISTGSSEDAKLIATGNTVNDEVLAGTDYNLSGTIENIGNKKAEDIQLTILEGIGSQTGVIPRYEGDYVELSPVPSGDKVAFSLPLLITDSAPAGLLELTLQVSYTDSEGSQRSTVAKIYITIVSKATEDVTSEVVITDVSQSPEQPMVGQKVVISFAVENRGDKSVTDVQVGGENLSTAGFEPYTAQTYKEIGSIAAGDRKKVSLEFKVGSGISEGLNTLDIGCKYTDVSGKKQNNTTSIYVLNVVNESNSKPKIIVSDFTKDTEELKAGSTFLFTYTLKNTHTSKAAKNIKVTITQADNVFSAAQGTNSFYIDKIDAGESVERSIELKVKSDVTTAAYELQIIVEYEYDDMSQADLEAGGVTETNKLKLQAVENLRPSVQNFGVGLYGETPYAYTSSSMFFDFVNMGKSALNNVRFSLDGDFTLETGNSYFQGTVMPGMPEYIELMVIPQTEGMCSGTLYITFEDSNGDEIVFPYEFSDIMVMGQPTYDDPGIYDPGFPVYDEIPEEAKEKAIMPVWLFIVIQVAILVVFVPVVRAIGIAIHKKKLRNKEEEL